MDFRGVDAGSAKFNALVLVVRGVIENGSVEDFDSDTVEFFGFPKKAVIEVCLGVAPLSI
jgi:hypothetical protein